MIGQNFLKFLLSFDLPPIAMIIAFMVMYIIMGMFLDSIGMIVITVPVLLPVVKALGYDPLWYGVLLLVNFELATITPPYGLCLLIASLIADINFEKTIKTVMVFFSVMLLIVMFSVFFPDVILLIPRVLAPKLMGPM